MNIGIGFVAGIISFVAYLVYIVSTLRGRTRPSRSTWWILTLVGILILWSSYELGALESFWIQLSYVVGPLIISFLSIKYGEGEGLSKLDKICLSGAIIAGLIWYLFNSAFVGLLGSIIVDFIGLFPTFKKVLIKPEEEDPNAWLLETVSSFLNIFSITVWFSLKEKDWIYAVYLFFVNFILTFLMWRFRITKIFNRTK